MWGWHMDSGWGWWWMFAMMLAFWIGLVWMVVSATGSRSRMPVGDAGVSAREILDRRYASGEINEFEHSRISGLLEG